MRQEVFLGGLREGGGADGGAEDDDAEQPGAEELGPEVLVVGRTKYFGVQPPYTKSGTNHLPQPLRTVARVLAAVKATEPAESVRDTVAVMDDQPDERLILRAVGEPVDPGLRTFDPANARRLYELTRKLF